MPKKVLIVDDEEDILWGLSEELSRHNLEVDTASNGTEALDKIKSTKYDFLITDIRMPGLSGSELLLEAKKIQPELKVIVMTAYGSEEIKEDVLSKGAISYLEKPFDFEQLLDILKEKEKAGEEETIRRLSLVQFLQLVSMEGQSCEITVDTPEGEGKIYFLEGELVNASIGKLKGEEAFAKIFEHKDSPFQVNWTTPKVKKEIEKPLHALLLGAVAKQEELEQEEALSEEIDLSELSKLLAEEEEIIEEQPVEEIKEEVKEEVIPEIVEEVKEEEPEEEITLEEVESLLESYEEEVKEEEVVPDIQETPVEEIKVESEPEPVETEEPEVEEVPPAPEVPELKKNFEEFVKDVGDVYSIALLDHTGRILERYDKVSTGLENIPREFGSGVKSICMSLEKAGLGKTGELILMTDKYSLIITQVKPEYFIVAVIPPKTMKTALIKLRMKNLAQELAKILG